MDTNHPFVTASRRQLRFATAKGHLNVEDLWELSLKDLDAIALRVDGEIKPGARKSFLENPDKKADQAAADNELRLEVLKFVIDVKQAENKAARSASEKRAQITLLKELRDKKLLQGLESLTAEQIEAQLKELEATV